MFILRNGLAAAVRRRHRHACAQCAAPIHRFERWCPFCMTPNPQFSETVFDKVAGCSVLRAVAIGCTPDPEHRWERLEYMSFRRSHRRTPTLRGCGLCGTPIRHDEPD